MSGTEKPENKKITLLPMMSDEQAAAIAKETLKNLVLEERVPEIGESVSGQGIFLGQYSPKDQNGKSLGKIFNVFAAPEDLSVKESKSGFFKKRETVTRVFTFNDAAKLVAELKDWHGHDGASFENSAVLTKALKDGSYKGEWVIPPREILSGKDVDGNDAQQNHLYKHQNKGAFKGTFKTAASSGSDCPDWYCSSTEDCDHSSEVHGVLFSDGYESWLFKDDIRLSCRPVRLVAASSAPAPDVPLAC